MDGAYSFSNLYWLNEMLMTKYKYKSKHIASNRSWIKTVECENKSVFYALLARWNKIDPKIGFMSKCLTTDCFALYFSHQFKGQPMFNLPASTYTLSIHENGELSIYNENDRLVYTKLSNGIEIWYEYDENNNLIHHKNSKGYECWREYNEHGKMIHYNDSDGDEEWFNAYGDKITEEEFDRIHAPCAGKVIEVEGKKYRLTAV
jgi:YD repeat-containing protein